MKRYDSLIFDMDGTLWDAIDAYSQVWNVTLERLGIARTVSRGDILRFIGKPLDMIYDEVMCDYPHVDKKLCLKLLDDYENELLPQLGGTLYDGVREGIAELSQHYPLFMASNCGVEGVRNMLAFSGLTQYFKGTITHGETRLAKGPNIVRLMQTFSLSKPLYIGDTQSDGDAATYANIDMCHVKWGFGTCRNPQLTADTFPDLVRQLV